MKRGLIVSTPRQMSLRLSMLGSFGLEAGREMQNATSLVPGRLVLLRR
jgi:hypothetical protein